MIEQEYILPILICWLVLTYLLSLVVDIVIGFFKEEK